MSAEEIRRLFGTLLDTPRKADVPGRPKTTDKPDITRFMLQMMNEFGKDADDAGLRWAKTFRDKASGRKFTVTVELRETA